MLLGMVVAVEEKEVEACNYGCVWTAEEGRGTQRYTASRTSRKADESAVV
jgi:hypothetical protein